MASRHTSDQNCRTPQTRCDRESPLLERPKPGAGQPKPAAGAGLREIRDDVEAALAAVASHAAVLATQHAEEVTFTLQSFESMLGRLRKESKPGARSPGNRP